MLEALIAPFLFALIVIALLVVGVVALIRRRAARATDFDMGHSARPGGRDSAGEDTERRHRRTG